MKDVILISVIVPVYNAEQFIDRAVQSVLCQMDGNIELILPPVLNLRSDPDHFIYDFAWNKIYRSKIISRENMRFDESRRIWEDRPFLAHYLLHCSNYYAMDRCFYNYVDVPDSLSRRYSLDFFRIILANFKHYSDLFSCEFDFDTEYANTYWCHSIENMIFRSLEQTENTEQIQKNILETLQDEQVVHWYANRKPENEFESNASRLVTSGSLQEALSIYKKKLNETKKRNARNQLLCKVKWAVKKVLGG